MEKTGFCRSFLTRFWKKLELFVQIADIYWGIYSKFHEKIAVLQL